MSEPVIHGVNLGKRYEIGERERYLALRDLMAKALRAPMRALSKVGQQSNHGRKHIWALRNASFDIREGEVVGLIGRNGAGKTTLLKILARVTRPTEGHAEIRGRMGSLLEVGTGFHPELTGRENVFLSGAILGMSRNEIVRKFDEIVAFAEVEKFIDTPLKHYSSGMQMRLAFAVAAHLEPEILLVDEVLAVGDMAFQKKCLGKMSEVARGGRTIVFVSHDLGAITRLCQRAIYLSAGGIAEAGSTSAVVGRYMADVASTALASESSRWGKRIGDGRIRFTRAHFEDMSGTELRFATSGQDCRLVMAFECPDGLPKRNVVVSFALRDPLGVAVMHHRSNFTNQNFDEIPVRGAFICNIPQLPLTSGEYSLTIFVAISESTCDLIDDALQVTVGVGDFFGTGIQGVPEICRVLTKCDWAMEGAARA
jgi:lipopolysaccharide transport system ATP-binding protein